jgi:hypothetical protein
MHDQKKSVHFNLTASFIRRICCHLTVQELMENAVSKMPPKTTSMQTSGNIFSIHHLDQQ